MIAAHLEPKGLKSTERPIWGDDAAHDKLNARQGSRMLRNAILRAKGLPTPQEPLIVCAPPQRRHIAQFKPRIVPSEPTPSVCCDKCGAPVAPRGTLVADIQAAVTAYYRLSENALVSEQRGRDIAHPRQIAMLLASELTRKSLPDIGRRFNRDHTTVLYAIRITRKRIATDEAVAHDVATIRRMLGK